MSLTIAKENVITSQSLPDKLLLSGFFLMATVMGAYVYLPLPFTPVPLTAQTFFVLLGAAYLGRAWGTGVQGLYLFMGAVGLPVLGGGIAGLATLSGPTAGYLWAFLPAAWMVAHLIDRCHDFGSRLILFTGASLLILVTGTVWLAFLLRLGFVEAMIMGFLPFLVGDLVKSAAAASLVRRMAEPGTEA